MSKSTITRLFIGSVVAVVAGALLMVAAIWIAYASDSFIMSGPDVTGIRSTGLAWTMVGLGVVSVLALLGGCIGGLVSWIGALLNTAELTDKTWFIILLVLGLFSFGLVAMIAYVIAGPDGHRSPATPQVHAPV
jgi:MFS family permease